MAIYSLLYREYMIHTTITNSPRTLTIAGNPPKTTWMRVGITKAITITPNAINME